jgi:glycosyltransferase involved in cell wall biosynthesis
MKILMLADPVVPVPPIFYGGVERVINVVSEELIRLGLDITVLCHPLSTCAAKKLVYPDLGINRFARIKNMLFLIKHITRNKYDIIHSFAHFDMLIPFWPLRMNIIQSFQSLPHSAAFRKRLFFVPRRNLFFTTCGYHMVNQIKAIAETYPIHNCVPTHFYDFKETVADDAPLVFLGRIEPIKGVHHAIRIALETNQNLIIAGNRSNDPRVDAYFQHKIEPYLSKQIQYIGPINDDQKNKILGSASALLMPIEWDEPFGIVMAESLACGTPVIGFSRGSVPEIIMNGLTGQACHSIEEMCLAVRNLNKFSRKSCRDYAEKMFSSQVIANNYVSLYNKISKIKNNN